MRPAYRIDAGFHSDLCGAQRFVDCPDFISSFEFAFRPEGIRFRRDTYLQLSKLIGEMNRKRRRYFHTLNLQIRENVNENLRRRWKLRAAALPSFLIMRIRQYFIDHGLALCTIEFQVVHYQISFAVLRDEDERIGRKKTR